MIRKESAVAMKVLEDVKNEVLIFLLPYRLYYRYLRTSFCEFYCKQR
jgi:hypothetical protein